jgi:tetratricopeptide (TPR) repeat protein
MEREIDGLLARHFREHPLGRGALWESFPELNSGHLEAAYGIGCDLWKHGKYGDAECVFYFLVQMDPYEIRHWKALGDVLRVEKKYREALGIYLGAFFLDPKGEEVLWAMANCCLALGEREGAREFLSQLCEVHGEGGKRMDLAQRARGLLEMMERKGGSDEERGG